MLSPMSSVCLLVACFVLITSTHAVDLPANYTLPKTSENLCFIARFNLTLNVEYLKIDGKKTLAKIPLNNDTFQCYDGTCALADKHTLTITMLDNLTTITFEYVLNEKNQTSLKRVFGAVTINNNSKYFPNCSTHAMGVYAFNANESLFSTDRSNSYRCNTQTKIDNFKSSGDVTIKSIELENLRVQPFVDSTVVFHDFGAEKVCGADYFRSTNLIPIIVGVCLAVLVLVVLVAYLIGRRRSRNGYQSV